MEQETAGPDQQIANEGDEEYRIVSISSAALYAFEGQVHEQ